jgi:hypothetical protein
LVHTDNTAGLAVKCRACVHYSYDSRNPRDMSKNGNS